MAYKDEEFFGKFLDRFTNAKRRPFVRSAKKAVRIGEESPASAAENLRAQAEVYGWKPGRVERAARRIQSMRPKAIATERYSSLTPIIEESYADLYGRLPSPEELSRDIASAAASRISPSDPGAFSAYLGNVLMSRPEGQSKIKTEQDIAWEQQYGTMPRDEEGNLIRGVVAFDPSRFQSLVSQASQMFS